MELNTPLVKDIIQQSLINQPNCVEAYGPDGGV